MQITNILRKHVSFYAFLGQKECHKLILFSVLNDIRKGVYADAILKLRNKIDDKQSYRKKKKQLPSVCFSGIFWDSHYKHNVNLYTNLLVVDIDHIENEKSGIRQLLINDPKIVALWESASGQGFKALLYINYSSTISPENLWVVHEKCAFPQVQQYLKKSYGIKIDPSGKDVTRHCFVSYDPNIFLRREFEPFNVTVNLSSEAMEQIRKQYLSRKQFRNRKQSIQE